MHPEPDALAFQNVPPAVLGLVRALADAGHEAVLVGGCVRDLLRGVRVADFDLATAATPEQVLALFPRAIPIGLAHGTVMVPTPAGPVDVTSYRAGPSLRDDLAHRDFTLNALAWSPEKGELIDPFGGRVDLAQACLRAVGSARERLAEDPLRRLRAARLVAQLDVRVDSELEQALQADAHAALAGVARERVRRELALLLLAPHAGAGLALLRRTQLEAVLAPGAAPDAAEVVPALPLDLELRLAGWLRGARAAAVLRSHRYSRRVIARVEHLLRLHPIEAGAHASQDASVRRLLRRAGEQTFDALVALRHAELVRGEAARRSDAAAASARLRELEQAVARVRHAGALALHRFDLAIRGDEVMRLIGGGPGPHVGRALRFLTECVIEDPACNTPAALRARLADWQAERNSADSRPPLA
jgi:tRNA nucleotidyltransferase (CCA-adding enzyme)